jgi:hypothetical protein
VWWIWVLFAVGNLVDLAVQGHDHVSLVAALILVLVTGVMYATVQRPRVVADDEALTIVNPLRDHHIGWSAVAGAEAGELVRVRCEGRRRAIYAWAIYSSRRRQDVAQMRAQRMTRSRRRDPATRGYGDPTGAAAVARTATEPNDSERLVAAIIARADESRALARPEARPLVSAWHWPAVAAIVIPALALVIAISA